MIPFLAFLVLALAFWLIGLAGVGFFRNPGAVLATAFGLMLFLTASAHWGKRRPDLIRMVPAVFPRPGLLVTITGVLEILGAIGLFIPSTRRTAAICLAILLIAMFPANAHAAREKLAIGGRPVPQLAVRASIQVVFVAALIVAAWLD